MKWYVILGIILGVIILVAIGGVFIYFIVNLLIGSSGPTGILTITNEFDFPIWVEGKYGNDGTPVPLGQSLYLNTTILNQYASTQQEQDYWKAAITTVELPPGMSVTYNIDPGGIAGARFWGKFSCAPCGPNGNYATAPSLCLPPYPVGCSTNSTCQYMGAGTDCIIGDSSQYYIPPKDGVTGGTIGGCPPNNCSVPIDSLFEATFGCSLADQTKCNVNPSSSSGQLLGPDTYFDTSQVDGYTFPYIVLVTADTGSLDTCINTNSGNTMPTVDIQTPNNQSIKAAYIDASGLITGASGLVMDYDQDEKIGCPDSTNLSYNGVTTATDSSFNPPITYSLTNVNLGLYMDQTSGEITFPYISNNTPISSPPPNSVKIGCMSSCKRLNYGQPFGMNQAEGCVPTLLYCCPTTLASTGCTGITGCCAGPSTGCSNGTSNNVPGLTGCVSSDQCNKGPVVTSDYVTSVHNMAPGIYAFAYDDKQGLYSCGQGVKYEVIFGPSKSNPTDYWNNVWNNLNK